VSDAASLVRRYLAAMEARDLDAAAACLADGFTMTFPGGVQFRTPAELAAWGATRYARIGKRYDSVDVAPADDGEVVYCCGTLHGERLDGTPFEGIRFVDRFTVRDGRLVDQQVWNDLAETWYGPGN